MNADWFLSENPEVQARDPYGNHALRATRFRPTTHSNYMDPSLRFGIFRKKTFRSANIRRQSAVKTSFHIPTSHAQWQRSPWQALRFERRIRTDKRIHGEDIIGRVAFRGHALRQGRSPNQPELFAGGPDKG